MLLGGARVSRNKAPGPVDLDLIRRSVTLAAILAHYQLDGGLKRVGSQLVGRCPIHGGTNDRQFVVNPEKQTWKCFAPRHESGGGTLELVAELEKTDVRGAALLIAGWFAIPIERDVRDNAQRNRSVGMSGNHPSHKVFTVDGDGEDAFWTRIGSAWTTKGDGFNIVLSALPVNGRLVMRPWKPDEEEDEKKSVKDRGRK